MAGARHGICELALNGASVAGASNVLAPNVFLLLTVKVKVNVPEGPVGGGQ
jgi:hypothetical protein